jgi:hypothetical protein
MEDFSEPESGQVLSVADSLFEKIATVAIFKDPVYAYISKTILDSGGIDCFITNDCTTGAVNLFSCNRAGYKLRVRESEMKRAVELLLQEPVEE